MSKDHGTADARERLAEAVERMADSESPRLVNRPLSRRWTASPKPSPTTANHSSSSTIPRHRSRSSTRIRASTLDPRRHRHVASRRVSRQPKNRRGRAGTNGHRSALLGCRTGKERGSCPFPTCGETPTCARPRDRRERRTHFGYHDAAGGDIHRRADVYLRLRNTWKEAGCHWFAPDEPPPKGWSASEQLKAVERD